MGLQTQDGKHLEVNKIEMSRASVSDGIWLDLACSWPALGDIQNSEGGEIA